MKTFDGREKSLLRAASADVLPQSVVERKKSPYPSTRDPAYGRFLRQQLAEVLADPDAPVRPLLDRERTRALVAPRASGARTTSAACPRPWAASSPRGLEAACPRLPARCPGEPGPGGYPWSESDTDLPSHNEGGTTMDYDKKNKAPGKVKKALERDLEQTKHDLTRKGVDLNQSVTDTVKQATGKEDIPPPFVPNIDKK